MKKFAAVDIGNTTTKITLFEDSRIVSHQLCAGPREALDYCKTIKPDATAYCTTSGISEEVKKELSDAGWWHFYSAMGRERLPVAVEYKNVESLGPDRLAAAIGSAVLFPESDKLIADAGTALTLDIVTSQGIYKGGNISPGMKLRFKALHEFTYTLPEVTPQNLDNIRFGADTVAAIACGVEWGMAYEITGTLKVANDFYRCCKLLLTGGDAGFIKPFVEALLPNDISVSLQPDLVALGLKEAYIYNHEK